jgi:hypothetical protein
MTGKCASPVFTYVKLSEEMFVSPETYSLFPS